MTDKVSVIIRTSVSRAGCLNYAIDSILQQTYQNIEIILIENGSNGLQDIFNSKNLGGITFRYCHLSEANRCAAGNIGLAITTGQYICFLDDDDIFYRNHLEVLVEALKNNISAGAAYSLSHEVESNIISYTPFECIDKSPHVVFKRDFTRGGLFVNNYFPIQSVLFRKQLFLKHGGFNENLQRLEDWDLWVRYASQSDFIFVNEVTSLYRKPADRTTIASRNLEHDQFYFVAREKQSEIITNFDAHLFDEIAYEIFQRTKISKAILCIFYNKKLSKNSNFNRICEQRNLDAYNNIYEMSVLDAIRLTSEVVTSHRLLWNFHRAENCIQKKLRKLADYLKSGFN